MEQISSLITGTTRFLALVCFVTIFLASAFLPAQASQKPFTFIAIGDTPYSDVENDRLKSIVSPAIKKANPPFVVHYGDLKGGGEACTEALLIERQKQVLGYLPGRVFYTPGDNDWTDCDRSILDPAVSELASLDLLRDIFFSKPMELPENWGFARQANFPENARWTQDGIYFVTVHLVSTNNGRMDILKDDIELALSLVDARDQANRVWLEEAFKVALKAKARAMVIITQADVTSPDAAGPCTATNRVHCDAFQLFRDNLRLLAGKFAEQGEARKPVLLLHGDSNPYCIDSEFGEEQASNLWQLNAWGDFSSPADATVVTVDPENEERPFTAETLLGKKAPVKGCK